MTTDGHEQDKSGVKRTRIRSWALRIMPLVIFVLLGVIAVQASNRSDEDARAFVGDTPTTSAGLGLVDTLAQTTETTAAVPRGIPWQEALEHVGESATIVGPVAGTAYAKSSNGSPTFLNIGVDYPNNDRLTVVIWGEDRGRFPSAPEAMYGGKNVAVTGVVERYEGRAEIIVSSPSQIQVY